MSNLSARSRKLYHQGAGEVSRSSLSWVNSDNPWDLYEALFGRLLSRCQASLPGHGFRFRNKLHSLGATDAASAEGEHRRGGRDVFGLRVDQLVDSARGLPADTAQEGDQVAGRGEARSQSAAGNHVRPDHRVHERARTQATPLPAAADRLPRPRDGKLLRLPDDQLAEAAGRL